MARHSKYFGRIIVTLSFAIAIFIYIANANGETYHIDVTDDIFEPSKVDVKVGDVLVFHNASRMIHSVHIDTRSENFGFKHMVNEHLVYPDTPLSVTVTDDFAPGTYYLGCALHSRMRGRIVVADVTAQV